MATNQKEVKVKIATEEELSGVEALELRVKNLQKQKIQLSIDTKTEKLNQIKSEIDKLKQEKATLDVDVNDAEINEINSKISQLDQQVLDLELSIETDELTQAKLEIDELDNEEIEIQLRSQSAMEAIDQIGQGFDRLKAGASEIGEQMSVMLESAGKQETNKAFLEHAVGAEKAASAIDDINASVQKLPGDDTVMQGLLSQAIAKDASLTATELDNMGTAAADYFSAMSYYGKSSTEAFQDMNNYLLAGNTAEIERSPILANHIDKLKEGTTLQERSKLLQEALNEEHWGGMSQQDTYNNKLETFNGMLERGQYNLGGMFQEGAKGAMDFIMQLDDATNGLVGMGIALGGFASPITDTIMGLGQMATGVKAIKDLGLIKYLKESAAAQWLLNIAQEANPIMLVVLAITALILVLGYLYFNNEQVRESINALGQGLLQFGQWVYNGAIYWLDQLRLTLENLWNYITTLGGLLPANVEITGNQIVDSILRVLMFLLTLPLQIGMIFTNIIARALGFGNNFVQNMLSAGSRSVSNFMSYITTLPGRLQTELSNMLSAVSDWANTLPQKFWDAGVNAVKNFLDALGIHSPGTMQRMLLWEINEMGDRIPRESQGLLSNVSSLGSGIIDEFGEPSLGLNYDDTMNAQLESINNTGNANGNTYNFNLYGDMDNEERMTRFVDEVIRRLHFENTTAGRTV